MGNLDATRISTRQINRSHLPSLPGATIGPELVIAM